MGGVWFTRLFQALVNVLPLMPENHGTPAAFTQINTVHSLEIQPSTGGVVLSSLEGGASRSGTPTFKLCACGSGKLFLVDSQTTDGCSSSTHLCSP